MKAGFFWKRAQLFVGDPGCVGVDATSFECELNVLAHDERAVVDADGDLTLFENIFHVFPQADLGEELFGEASKSSGDSDRPDLEAFRQRFWFRQNDGEVDGVKRCEVGGHVSFEEEKEVPGEGGNVDELAFFLVGTVQFPEVNAVSKDAGALSEAEA